MNPVGAKSSQRPEGSLTVVKRQPGLRALAWDGEILYASRGYEIVRGHAREGRFSWEPVARFVPATWRRLTR